MATAKDAFDWLTAGAATIGAALGLINFWRQASTDRVKLKVSPALVAGMFGGGVLTVRNANTPGVDVNEIAQSPLKLAIEVVNLGSFSIVLYEIGIHTSKPARPVFFRAATLDGRTLPIRIEPRDAITIYTQGYQLSEFSQGQHVYVATVCGTRTKASSPILKDLYRRAIALSKS